MATRTRSRTDLARPEILVAQSLILQRAASWIETDGYDRDAFHKFTRDSPSFRALAASGGRLLPHFDPFLLDLYALLYKPNLVFRPTEAVLPSALFYGPLLQTILATPALEALRLHTVLDESRAATAALLLGEKILAALKSEWLLNRGQMLDLWALRLKEEEIAERWAEASTAAALAESTGRADFARLAQRLEQNASLEERRLLHRSHDVQRLVRDSVRRQGQRLQAEVAHASSAVADMESAVQEWGNGLGNQVYRSAALQIELGKQLCRNPRLRKLANLVGRMRLHAQALRQQVLERCTEETYSVGQGRDLGRILPCEVALLHHRLRRRDFARRLLEGTLLQYELRGNEESGRGPLIVCLDVSSSMSGDKEIWAKAVALTLLDIAQRQRRLLHAICFAGPETPLGEWDLNFGQRYTSEPQKVLEFASYFPGGGTDFQRPLEAAAHCLERGKLRKGDVVFITDGECQVDPAWLAHFAEEKKRLGFRLFSVLIDVGPASVHSLQALSDRLSSVRRLTSDAGGDLFLAI